ncbi:hypothetical protein Pmani_035354 [Petrolisthes manimaculis]|uniref:Uncharacterized protein n=1 Tax=Petrolisthes manimaculis TaxID=1843537 RepID=A0AAE1TNA4_9EUCA|nr:hypothetical protein Pmani_035354 [Petrolisthes manimaculis]
MHSLTQHQLIFTPVIVSTSTTLIKDLGRYQTTTTKLAIRDHQSFQRQFDIDLKNTEGFTRNFTLVSSSSPPPPHSLFTAPLPPADSGPPLNNQLSHTLCLICENGYP